VKDILRRYEYDILKCVYCGQCRQVCPTFGQIGWESSSPRGKVKMIHGWLKGDLPLNDRLVDQIYLCAGCEHCTVECPSKLPVVDLIRDTRKELVKSGKGPLPSLKAANDNILLEKNVLGKPHNERMSWRDFEGVTIESSGNTDYAYFVGCMPSYWCSDVVASTIRILRRAKFDFGLIGGEEWCCGMPMIWSGEEDKTKAIVKHNVDKIHELGAKRVLTTCPGCYTTLTREYQNITGKKNSFKVIHVLDLLYELLKEEKLKFENKMDKLVVTYHDPCHIGRSHGKFEQARHLIESIPGMALVEMKKNRQDANCCGGSLSTVSDSLSLAVGTKRIKEALETRANLLVTACPQCYVNLRRSAIEANANIDVIDLTVLVAGAIGL